MRKLSPLFGVLALLSIAVQPVIGSQAQAGPPPGPLPIHAVQPTHTAQKASNASTVGLDS